MTNRILWVLCTLFFAFESLAQCELFDGNGVMNANPVWVSCSGADFTLFIQSNTAFGAYSIDWGDGSAATVGAALIPPTFVSHTYTAAIANYTVTFTEPGTGCIVTGMVVMEEPVNASIQIPIGGVTQICAPDAILFSNSSTDVSNNTVFTWDFGDGSPIETYGDTNAGQTVTHTYEQNTVNCVTAVTLTAENFCSFGNPTTAVFNPIQVFDIDDAAITASAQLLCYPDTVVHFDNTTNRNCVPQGNTVQRFEYWNFGDYWGLGYDSIVDWQPFLPPNRPGYDIAYPGIGTYTVMMIDSNQCGRDTAFIAVDIVPQPTAAISASDDTVCTGEQLTFFNNSFGGSNQHRINFGDGTGWFNINISRNKTYNTAGTFTVLLAANINGGSASCTDTTSIDVVVLPSPIVNFSVTPVSACDSLTATFTNTSTGGVTYAWDFDNGNTSTLQNPGPEFYGTPNPYDIALTVTSNNGCVSDRTESIDVYASPVAAFTAANVCEDELASFFDNTTIGYGGGITSWLWSFGDAGSNTSALQNPMFTYVDSGTFIISLAVATANCTDTISDTISVEPRPVAIFSESDSIGCSPLNVTFTDASTGAVNFFWDFGDGNTSTIQSPIHTFNHSGLTDTTFVVKLISSSAFGCADSTFDTITVLGNPVAQFVSNATLDCAPLDVQFTNGSTGQTSVLWDFGDGTGSVLDNPSHTFQNLTQFITNYSVTLIATAANGCTDTAADNITVYPEPLFNFNIVPDSGCSPLLVQFPVAVGAVVYEWDFGDGTTTTGPSPSHTFVNGTTNNQNYNVQLVATSPFGCVDSVQGTVVVFPNPAAVVAPLTASGCEPLTVNFFNTSTGGTTFLWDFDDGNTTNSAATNISHVYPNATNDTLMYQASLIVTTDQGCADTAIADIDVYRRIIASFAVDSNICHPFNAVLSDSSTNPFSWSWDFDDGDTSNLQNPAHTFSNTTLLPQTFDVNLEVSNLEGCTDDTTITTLVFPKPTAAFTLSDSVGCEPLAVTITNNSVLNQQNEWDFGDGTTSTSNANQIALTYPNPTNIPVVRTIELMVENQYGCRDTANRDVEIHSQIHASFSMPTEGCHPLQVAFSNASVNAVSFAWNFGDGTNSTLATPSHTFTNLTNTPQNYDVTLTVTNSEGCTDDTTITVTVHPKPLAGFQISSSLGCEPLVVTFTNVSVLNDTNHWDFDNGVVSTSNATSIIETYVNPTNGPDISAPELIVTTTFGCKDTFSTTIEVHPQIIAGFTVDSAICHPKVVQFTDQSTNASQYQYDFGDLTANSVQDNPIHLYNNFTNTQTTYTATQIVTNAQGCQDAASITIDVFPKPQAQFDLNGSPLCNGEQMSIVNQSTLNDQNIWTYGGNTGFTITDNRPVIDTILYNFTANANDIPVRLIVENIYGCRDTASSTITVYPEVEARFSMPEEGCSPFEVDFINLSSGHSLSTWNFGDGNQSVDEEPIHIFENTSSASVSYDVVLTATSAFGCSVSDTLPILIHPTPDVVFTATPLTQRFPNAQVNVSNLTGIGPWDYSWDFDDSTILIGPQPGFHIYDTWGEFTITLTATSEFCEDTATQTIIIEPPLPVAAFELDTVGCAPIEVTFRHESEYGVEFLWDFGDGGRSSSENPIYTYAFPGQYTVQLTVTGPGGETSVLTQVNAVVVNRQPIANFTFTPGQVTVPTEPVTFINYSQFGEFFFWDFGDSTTSEEENPQHLYRRAGTYFPYLTVETTDGCRDTMFSDLPVTAEEAGNIQVPNAFTPSTTGGTGGYFDPQAFDNQVFFPVIAGVSQDNYMLSIYNRWGELIFETEELSRGWDGYYRGEACQQDVYVWKMKGEYVNGSKFSKVGDVTLLR